MSIWIKGMKMPTSCSDCRFYVDKWCYATDNNGNLEPSVIPKWCPLVEVVMPNIVHWLNDIEIVRCNNCKYFEEIMTARYRDGTTKEVQICKKLSIQLKDENFYCGWGERKE